MAVLSSSVSGLLWIMKSIPTGSFMCPIILAFKVFVNQNLCCMCRDNHSLSTKVYSTQRFLIMRNELCLCIKGNKAVKAPLKRKLTGKGNKISRYSFIEFVFTDIEWRTFNKGSWKCGQVQLSGLIALEWSRATHTLVSIITQCCGMVKINVEFAYKS